MSDDVIEIHVTRHWDDERPGRLYTMRVNSTAEYVALLQRLAGYAYLEERCDHAEKQISHDEALQEKAALEWRLGHLNKIIQTALNPEEIPCDHS